MTSICKFHALLFSRKRPCNINIYIGKHSFYLHFSYHELIVYKPLH
jgi:hypothetical protein